MERLFICIFTILCFILASIGRRGFGPGEQEWGYVEVRPNAHMFWWLYYTTADVESYYDKPLMIWLQGGPGSSSTAYGNFEELGPLDTDLKPRNYTWVKKYNVLFIDNPVGAGFSYANVTSAFATTNAQIASDLYECIRGFYNQLPNFKSVPTYITTQSYGGKMGAEFALVWYRAQNGGTIESNLKGIALGDAWISPIDYVMTWAPFLLRTGMVDIGGFDEIDTAAKETKAKIEAGEWKMAMKKCAFTQGVISLLTYDIDFYNILTKRNYSNYGLSLQSLSYFNEDTIYKYFQPENDTLELLMNGPVKQALGLEVTHGNQSKTVHTILKEEIMKPVTNIVELLLDETNLKVFVYNGHLDLIVDISGTVNWVDNLRWKDADKWKNVTIREPLVVEDIVEGYYKIQDNFAMFWVNRAGHMVPRDNPAAMERILHNLTNHHTK
ncbi:unnamed protein product [Lasius platythorax]|uniref:Retinoid-inducible serine carboxypeptidase n=1 Tax=Lasius platythorax TaxID=488582 RepID=A0AAV2P1W5_9HYME